MLNLLSVVGLLIVVGIVSFWGGSRYQKSKVPNFRGGQQMRLNNNRPGGQGVINGEITAVDDNSITVKTMDGSSQIILLSSSTIYKKMADGGKSDLSIGKKVMVTGNKDNSGSISAGQISIGMESIQPRNQEKL